MTHSILSLDSSSVRRPGEARRLLLLAGPSVLNGLGWMAMGLVDTILVGRLGATELAGVGIGNSLFFAVSVCVFGFLDACVPLISQAIGSGDRRRAGALLWQGIWLGVALGVPIVVAFRWVEPVLGMLGQDPAVAASAAAYLSVRVPALLPGVLFSSHRAFLYGVGNTAVMTGVVLVANVVNAVADLVLIHGWGPVPAMGVRGAGLATTCSVTAMLACAAYIVHCGRYDEFGVAPCRPDRDLLRDVIRLGLPMSGQYCLEVAYFAGTTILVGWLGPVMLSAHQVALSLASLCLVLAEGLGTAATVCVGEAFGADDPERAHRAGAAALALTAGFMGLTGVGCLVMRRELASVYSADPAVQAAAAAALIVVAPMAMADGLQIVGGACLRAVSDSRTPFFAGLVGHWMVGAPLGYLLAFPCGMGLLGFWCGFLVSLGVVAAAVTRSFLRGAWAPSS